MALAYAGYFSDLADIPEDPQDIGWSEELEQHISKKKITQEDRSLFDILNEDPISNRGVNLF